MALRMPVTLAIWSWKALGPVALTPETASLIDAAKASGSVPLVG